MEQWWRRIVSRLLKSENATSLHYEYSKTPKGRRSERLSTTVEGGRRRRPNPNDAATRCPIQFLLGHVSSQTTERYLGCKQKLRCAVNDVLGIEPQAVA